MTIPALGMAIHRGPDVTIVTYCVNAQKCPDAAAKLAGDGIDAEAIDLRTLFPLDRETVAESVRRTVLAIVVDESPGYGGVSALNSATIEAVPENS